ncbi:MAG: rhodanese-like domain-containing protein [Actinomycetales bacterium]|jgi:phage shock protein E|tara:strand:+ start:136 stop:504 length:369 start_codon:yes stop_codon:yes gene_type:complete
MKFIKFLVAAMIAVFAVGSLAGCATESRAVTEFAAVIDVRTTDEWNSGHLESALLIPIASSNFDAQLEELDKAADYYIYCRSGNRAGQAIDRMIDAGFTGELVNGGSVANASKILNIAVVND